MPCWMVGPRDCPTAVEFLHDLQSRLASRVQLTTDAHCPYLMAVEQASGGVNYAQLIRLYGKPTSGEAYRYSPGECTGVHHRALSSRPDEKHISTSYIERQNLTMRMHMRRFTRLTNAFSKKLANHEAAVALHHMHYNFARVHQSLSVTSAMEAGVADHVWTVVKIVALLD